MPTNLPPVAVEAERKYREAQAPEERIKALEEFLKLIPKHKGTDHLRGDLKRKLAQLKDTQQTSKKGAARHDSAFRIPPEGAGQVVLIGATNTGKSTLVRALTHAEPEVSAAPFTTWEPSPGMMPFENTQVQLVDTPSLDRGYLEPEFADLVRRANLALLVVDLLSDPLDAVDKALEALREKHIVPEHEQDESDDPAAVPVRMLLVINKYDSDEFEENLDICKEMLGDRWEIAAVSAETGRNLDLLKQAIYQRLGVIRVYAKPPGKDPDREAPFILEEGARVDEFAGRVHRDFQKNLRYARVWGSAEHDGQMVRRDYELHEGDVVELHI